MLYMFISAENVVLEHGITQPLISSSGEIKQDEDEDEGEEDEYDISEVGSDESQNPVTSILSAYKLLTPSVKVCFPSIFIFL